MDDLRNILDPVIFLEKVRRPVLRGLVRERLDRRLAGLIGSGPGLLVPAGPRPTGLGQDHAAQPSWPRRRTPSAWYRAGTEDDDEVALTRHVGYALGSALADPGVIESAASGRVADLVRALDRPDVTPVQLIIDDLHEIAGTPAEGALETFLSPPPAEDHDHAGQPAPARAEHLPAAGLRRADHARR